MLCHAGIPLRDSRPIFCVFLLAWAHIAPQMFYKLIPLSWSEQLQGPYRLSELLEAVEDGSLIKEAQESALVLLLQPVLEGMASFMAIRMVKFLEEVNWLKLWSSISSCDTTKRVRCLDLSTPAYQSLSTFASTPHVSPPINSTTTTTTTSSNSSLNPFIVSTPLAHSSAHTRLASAPEHVPEPALDLSSAPKERKQLQEDITRPPPTDHLEGLNVFRAFNGGELEYHGLTSRQIIEDLLPRLLSNEGPNWASNKGIALIMAEAWDKREGSLESYDDTHWRSS
ncbi:hypothetical protein CEUSTIGMA_g5815.t1 [Chlamydomonas eustigma]|uniref:Uncharacterized protein n=1 Tax=Chlamydomonas eustigma TaxID=1157962 RepID=A0A250X5M3_9CHLO|nr:hypothetical protein CEUSTIGMA_g5815.t1 [Chlamydomonas eustigma]|eukprot:GAX78373.1 hypothetical protein CEUSTIGMA_g5815.t1 [Chlamydomonas eustigma]